MISSLIAIAVAPIVIIALYIYLRDKYEREPVMMLAKALLTGAFIVLPILFLETFMDSIYWHEHPVNLAAWRAFMVASFSEESFKFLAFLLLFSRSRQFNEIFDGIVYATFISLGFAAVENIMYVTSGDMSVGYIRAFTAVPAHAIFGIIMGYYLGFWKFGRRRRWYYFALAFLVPFAGHGLYDFLLMSGKNMLLLLFFPLVLILWVTGFRRVSRLSGRSVPIPPGDCE